MSLNEKREEGCAVHTCEAELSCVSMKSNASLNNPPTLSDGTVTSDPVTVCKTSLNEEKEEGNAFHTHDAEPSCVSLRSNASMNKPLTLSGGAVTSDPVKRHDLTCISSHCQPLKSQQTQTLLNKAENLQRIKDQHKTIMKNKFESLFEGIKLQENQTLLNRIYTQLYIIEGESKGVNEEHEVLHMEKKPTTQHSQDTPIYCNDIFKPLHEPEPDQREKIKSVLTKGIAGIGKTVSVQKFILDWAEGTANQDVDFMFVLPFRELNLIREHRSSLHKLLLDFHPELQDLDSKIYDECKVVFIFDGLDESRITRMFTDREKVSDVTETSSLSVLISNLIKGDLLPSALIWITSRPSAAHQIPSKYINRVTEIQGFTDPQKEEYFKKRISDEHEANRIISHIRGTRSLHIMCHIPVFCWISSTVLQNILTQDHSEEIPKTLTEMYIHFLLIQINMRNQKYDEKDLKKSNREVIMKLSEVAFKQLMKGNVMFYEEDLRECGIDITDASVYSGICTEIFKKESVIHQRKIYSFIHLSFQEFLAAFFVFHSYVEKNMEPLNFLWCSSEELSLYKLLKAVTDKIMYSGHLGHLDLFLRFLLGISLESNQRLLQDLLTHTQNTTETIKRTTEYIKNQIKGGERRVADRFISHFKENQHQLSIDRSINLFLCLMEMNDQTLYREIQEFVKSKNHSQDKLSPAHCSAIAYMLVMSEEVLDEFDLKKFNTSDEGSRRFIPAVRNCRKAQLVGCSLTDKCCESLASVLQSSNSLRDLNLSYSCLLDSGVKLISDGLKSSHCHLEKLGLTGCDLTDNCCENLASILQSSNSLRDLDLGFNDLKDLGVKLISDVLKSSHCQLNILRLSGCMVTYEGCGYLASALRSNPSHLIELDLSYNHPGPTGVQMLSERLNDPNCTLNTLNVDHGGEFRITAGPPKYACDLTLDSNTANNHLKVSDDNRRVSHVEEEQSYPDNEERFDYYPQVLCRESLTGRCYWEIQFNREADISVSYKEMNRKGMENDCWFGYNEKSWKLNCHNTRFIAKHKNNSTAIPAPSSHTNKVGVYLDWTAGILSFYSVSDTQTLTHIHTFNTTFVEPLYAGFAVYYPDSLLSLY